MDLENRKSDSRTKRKGPGLRLTPRELELLAFVLDQKFANAAALHHRFYQVEGSASTRYSTERLQLLVKHGFLRALRVYTERGLYYLASDLTKDVLATRDPERAFPEPLEAIDLRTFEHDKRVVLCRAARERRGELSDWYSERRLKASWAKESKGLAREYMPDAIYTSKAQTRVAFELELAPKTRERHSRKVSRFLDVMRRGQGPFTRTLFVACSNGVFETLASLTRPYPDFFRVERFEALVPESLRGGQANV